MIFGTLISFGKKIYTTIANDINQHKNRSKYNIIREATHFDTVATIVKQCTAE